MKNDPILTIQDLIEKDDLPAAIQQLKQLFTNSPTLNTLLMQSARFNALQKQIMEGTVDFEQANLSNNQIRANLLALLQQVRAEQQNNPVLQQEFTEWIGAKKVVIQNSNKGYYIEKIDNANFS